MSDRASAKHHGGGLASSKHINCQVLSLIQSTSDTLGVALRRGSLMNSLPVRSKIHLLAGKPAPVIAVHPWNAPLGPGLV